MPPLTPKQWFWFGYGAAGLFGGLRILVNPEFRAMPPTPRCVFWVLTIATWPIDFCMWIYYLYTKYK